MSYYETDRALAGYLLLHYGSPEPLLPYPFGPADALDFPVRCVSKCLDPSRLRPEARALDLGCAVGRASFELARHCRQVIGVDYSARLIEAARQLQQHGHVNFSYVEEGELTAPGTATVPAVIERERVAFSTRGRPEFASARRFLGARVWAPQLQQDVSKSD